MENRTDEEMYVFRIGTYDEDKLLRQVSAALEKRTEMVSRERYPGLWHKTDKLRNISEPRKSRLRTKVFSCICLLLGLFLLIPGMVKPQELMVPLLVGAIAVGAGIGGLWRSRKRRKNPFDKSARLLLQGKDAEPSELLEVQFSEEGMRIPTEEGTVEVITYEKFECVIEAEDIILIVFGERVMLLQKRDLVNGTPEAFCGFCAERIRSFQSIR